ncbi:hypothetical protein BX257_1451 [Streptomyces sp. 3212.3]|jgi:hypothetical protein|uniref:hypothetical protein n=1 Tax=Streptomyces sp. 3212.3 TaxID=1938846 RepID=UPI000E364229|nr:hypothetical protein [Streptomyces sp. 3212.3]REE58963.1 hypothetical protein BX257_1451 [Streptomyces sp. 3212.3]
MRITNRGRNRPRSNVWAGKLTPLVHEDVEPEYVRLGVVRALLGVVVYALAGGLGALVHPMIVLIAFLVLPLFYFLTSEGFLLAGAGTSSPAT